MGYQRHRRCLIIPFMGHRDTAPHLTSRQREILARISRGQTNIQIAEDLGIGFETVKMHVSDVLAELGVSSREEAAAWWRSERRPLSRLRGLGTGVPLLKLAASATAMAAVGAVGVLAIAGLAATGSSATPLSIATPEATTGAESTATPPAEGTPTTSPHVLAVSPNGSTTGSALRSLDPDQPGGICATVSFVGLSNNFQAFLMLLDNSDVTTSLTLFAASADATGGEICYSPPGGLTPGDHSATVRVQDSAAGVVESASWKFSVVPPLVGGLSVEPDASFPSTDQCNSQLFEAVFHRFFAAWNRGDAESMFNIVNDSRGVWFDLGYDPLAFAATGTVTTVELRTLDDFRALVKRYAGAHWTFLREPSGALVTTAPKSPPAVDGGGTWQLTGAPVTNLGKHAITGDGKFAVYCDSQKLTGVMGRPTVD
jgi:DNA-binding CsgD family transcriptional regulator